MPVSEFRIYIHGTSIERTGDNFLVFFRTGYNFLVFFRTGDNFLRKNIGEKLAGRQSFARKTGRATKNDGLAGPKYRPST